jgi:hypothetical protein
MRTKSWLRNQVPRMPAVSVRKVVGRPFSMWPVRWTRPGACATSWPSVIGRLAGTRIDADDVMRRREAEAMSEAAARQNAVRQEPLPIRRAEIAGRQELEMEAGPAAARAPENTTSRIRLAEMRPQR